ncbi:MAG: hypothetical protein OXD42_04065, partial [Rhodospirillaceae bacterium]|nr:hypothetical protein [Rhodospirillaceae bacterium]
FDSLVSHLAIASITMKKTIANRKSAAASGKFWGLSAAFKASEVGVSDAGSMALAVDHGTYGDTRRKGAVGA